jgi:hypothetical protein
MHMALGMRTPDGSATPRGSWTPVATAFHQRKIALGKPSVLMRAGFARKIA